MHKWKYGGLVLAVFLAMFAAFAVLRPAREGAPAVEASVSVRVDVSERRLYLERDGEVLESYPVAVGSAKHKTPRGTFSVRRIIWNPRWVPPEAAWARKETPKEPGHPDNPMGRVKIFFLEPDYYVHGTNANESIGKAASHGCIRMRNADIIELAQTLMDKGGAPVEPGLVRRLINRVTRTKEVRLTRPVRLVVQT